MGSGFALDSVRTFQNNRILKRLYRTHYNELKNAITNIKANYHKFSDKNQLSPEEIKRYKKKIKQRIRREKQKAFIISISITALTGISIYFISKLLYNYFLGV